MTEKFDAKAEIDTFLLNRQRYLKSIRMENYFYSEKYNFQFFVTLTSENIPQSRCTIILINNFEEYESIFKELKLFQAKESVNEVLRVKFCQFESNNKLPFYLNLGVVNFQVVAR